VTTDDQLRAIRATAEREIERIDQELGAAGIQHGNRPLQGDATPRREWAALAMLADARLRRCDDADL